MEISCRSYHDTALPAYRTAPDTTPPYLDKQALRARLERIDERVDFECRWPAWHGSEASGV